MLQLDAGPIAGLRALLDELQYDGVARTLFPNYFFNPFPPVEVSAKLLLHLPAPQRITYETLLLGQIVTRSRLEAAWNGGTLVQDLLDVGLLEPADTGRVRTANYSIIPYFGRYFVVTLNPYYPGSRDPDASVYIGPDSLTLAGHLLHLPPLQRALDLCAGGGIQAILAAASAGEVVAVELNPEAAHVARFNALLNRVADRVDVREGCLYEPAPAGPYDLIVSNPPFLSVPAGLHFAMCGHGGEDGLSVLGPLLERIPGRLTGDGQAIIYAEGVGDAEGPSVRQLLSQLAKDTNLDVHLLLTPRLSVKSALVLKAVMLQKLGRSVPAELPQWRDLYARLGSSHLFNYIVRMRRGSGRLAVRIAYDPTREERGIEVQPGVMLKPK